MAVSRKEDVDLDKQIKLRLEQIHNELEIVFAELAAQQYYKLCGYVEAMQAVLEALLDHFDHIEEDPAWEENIDSRYLSNFRRDE